MKIILINLKLLIFSSFILGIVYPLFICIIGTLFFPYKSQGSILMNQGIPIGSRLIGQNFSQPIYFHPRISYAGPSGYDGLNSGGGYLAPSSQILFNVIEDACDSYRSLNTTANTSIPADAVTSSASGLDPHISKQNALLQASRIAHHRTLSLSTIIQLIETHTITTPLNPSPFCNVLEMNLALDLLMQRD